MRSRSAAASSQQRIDAPACSRRWDDDGPYINLTFAASDHVAAWLQLRAVYEDQLVGRQLASSTVVVCEGADGWNDYLLLHHFDPSETVDDIRSR